MEPYLAKIKNRSERKQFASLPLQGYCPHHAPKNRLIGVDTLTRYSDQNEEIARGEIRGMWKSPRIGPRSKNGDRILAGSPREEFLMAL